MISIYHKTNLPEILNIRCSLCGYTFLEYVCKNSCTECLLPISCNMIVCPNCGYSFPSEKTVIGTFFVKIKKYLKKIKK